MISGASEEELTEAIGRADVLLEFMPKIKQLQKENKQLKDNWDKLKRWIKVRESVGFLKISIKDIICEMQVLEGSDSNVKD